MEKINLWYERFLILVLVIILLILSWCIYDSWYVYSHTIDRDILRYKPGAVTATADDPEISDEMVAWLTVDNTSIDYPVMQYSDNIKYLNTDPFGGYFLGGSIFLDCRNSPDFSDEYSLVYGHHMEFGRMFGALDSFLDVDYLLSHRTGTLIIGKNCEKEYRLTIFAALQTSASEKVFFEPTAGNALEMIKNKASVKTQDTGNRILALSTCTGSNDEIRTLVFAFLSEKRNA